MPSSMTSESQGFSLSLTTLVLLGFVFLGGMFVGSIIKENQLLKSGSVPAAGKVAGTSNDAGAQVPPEPTMNFDKVPEVAKDDHIRGNANAKIVLVEYSDFECPFCGRFHPTTSQVLKDYGDKVALVYRHYPLPFHPNAQKAAEGSECVAKLKGNEAFWTYADALFEVTNKDSKLSPEAITAAAQKAGVDTDAFKRCLDSGEMAEKVSKLSTAGGAAGVSGTPGTFVVVDGKAVDYINGAQPVEQVKAAIDQYLKS